ncbi:unnamed protein product [Polarella glacialis]|uniref:ShKT domain-containing protein n=1 Tax=Polarella glacialis TaxID=89957 RepID=A0A813END6_POLGL|nr:unnamed protein product [Polarella glacialis]
MALGRVLSGLGPSNLAALGLGHRVEALAYTVCEGFGAAASTIVGQWLGAGYEKEARHAAAHAAKFTAWVMVPLSVVMVLFPVPIVSVFTSDPVTVAASASYLRIIGFLAPAMGVEHVMDGALIGAGDTLPSLIWGLLLCKTCRSHLAQRALRSLVGNLVEHGGQGCPQVVGVPKESAAFAGPAPSVAISHLHRRHVEFDCFCRSDNILGIAAVLRCYMQHAEPIGFDDAAQLHLVIVLLITFRDSDNDECIFNETNFQDALTFTSEEKIWFTVHLPWAVTPVFQMATDIPAASPADEALAGRSLGTSAIPPARLVADKRAHLTGRSWHGMIFANFANMYALTFLGATRGAAPTGKPPVVCEDKRNDCHQYVGRGPLGNGCNQHSDYMRVHCARSCGRCDNGASEDELAVSTVTLGQGGLTAKMLSARGVRRWEFMELPVQEPSSSLECSEAAAADGQCQAVRLSNRSHVVAAHFYDSQSHHLNSTVYRWSPVSAGFEPHQALATVGAWGLTSFRLGDAWYLAVASYFDGGTRELNSTVFKWDASLDAFGRHQEMQITGATDVEFLPLGTGEAGVLAFAGHKGTGVAPGGECQLFLWDGRRFNLFQIVETSGAYDVEGLSSQGGNEVSFIVVHDDGADIFAASLASLLSGEPSPGFTLTQSLGISHGRDAEHFELDGGRYLVLSVFRNESSYEVESLIYKWDAREGLFLEMQRLPSEGAFDAELLRGGPEPLLMVSSQRSGVSQLYRLGGAEPGSSSFVLQGKLSIPRVYNVAWQCIPEAQECYLGVARFWD